MIAHKKMSESRIHHNYKEFLHIKMDPQSIIHENMYNFHFFTNQTGNEIIDMYIISGICTFRANTMDSEK